MSSLSRRIEIPQDAISAVIPVWRFGRAVAEMNVSVRPCFDQALGGLTASDIYIEDNNGDVFMAADCMKRTIIDEIHDHDGRAYAEIEAASGKLDKAA